MNDRECQCRMVKYDLIQLAAHMSGNFGLIYFFVFKLTAEFAVSSFKKKIKAKSACAQRNFMMFSFQMCE